MQKQKEKVWESYHIIHGISDRIGAQWSKGLMLVSIDYIPKETASRAYKKIRTS